MFKILEDIRKTRELAAYSAKLLLLRLRLLRLDASYHSETWQKMAIFLALSAMAALFGLLAFLFALNSVLPENSKFWVFLIIALMALLCSAYCLWQLPKMWQTSTAPIGQTLNAIQEDFMHITNHMQPETFDSSELPKDSTQT